MDVEKLSNELNDILIEFHNTLCNPSISCKDCEISNYRKKYNIAGSCNAIYLAIKLLGATEDTAIFINKQHIVFRSIICRDKGFKYCLNKCYIHDIRVYTDLLENRGSCFYAYLVTILLNDL